MRKISITSLTYTKLTTLENTILLQSLYSLNKSPSRFHKSTSTVGTYLLKLLRLLLPLEFSFEVDLLACSE